MSIISRCLKDSVGIRREVIVAGNEEAIRTWTTGARDSFPTVINCCAQPLPSEEAQMIGVKSEIRSFVLYFSSDPYIDTRDHVFVNEVGGAVRECFVLKPSFSFDGSRARLWKCIVADYLATEE